MTAHSRLLHRSVFPESQRHRCLLHVLRNVLVGAHSAGLSNKEVWRARKYFQRLLNELAHEALTGHDAVLEFKKRMSEHYRASRYEAFINYLDRAKFDIGERLIPASYWFKDAM